MTAIVLTDWIKNLGMSVVTVLGDKTYREYDFNNPDSEFVVGNHQGHELMFEAHLNQVMKENHGVITIRHIRPEKLISIYTNSEVATEVPQKDIYMFRVDETGFYPLAKDIVEKAYSINMKTGELVHKSPDIFFCQYSLIG